MNYLKSIWLVAIIFIFGTFVSYSQKTPEELGLLAFHFFKTDSIENFIQLKPDLNELKDLAATMGVDSNSVQFKGLEKNYDEQVNYFREKCLHILNDFGENKINWSNVLFEKVTKEEKKLALDNRDPNSKTIVITIVDIYFNANNKRFILRLGDVYKYNEIWRPGGNIELVKQ